MKKTLRIVLTGGPGGGKTTAADLFRRELGEKVIILPEAATMIYSGGFPRTDHPEAKKSSQKAIYHLQKNIEETYCCLYPDRYQICDRGSLDGAAYWPGNIDEFFQTMSTSHQVELNKYDGVVFFETAAVGGLSIEGGNPVRTENLDQAVALDRKLQDLWNQHPRYTFIPHDISFVNKIIKGLSAIESLINQLILNS